MPRADQHHFLRGIRTSTARNTTAFGFSLTAGGAYAALVHVHGEPSWLELYLFLIAACLGFAVVNTLSTRFFRKESPDEPEVVVSLGTSLSVFSVCGSVGIVTGIAFAFPAWAAWPVAGVAFTLAYLIGVGAEIGLAAHQHPRGGVSGERSRSGRR
jgi:hypothetical protein